MQGDAMHFQFLVEDQSGKVALDILVPKIIGMNHTFDIKAYKGIGRIPPGMKTSVDASKRILLDNLPRLLRGYAKSWPQSYGVIIVVCDLDDKYLKNFRDELIALLNTCDPHPETRFCIAIEEGEAWFLGDIPALKRAYPKAKDAVLNSYVNDSICGTWEKLADAVYKGGSQALSRQGWKAVGAEKSAWAENIAPHMNLAENQSPSFNYLLNKLRELAEVTLD
jgi:hypothetical protein